MKHFLHPVVLATLFTAVASAPTAAIAPTATIDSGVIVGAVTSIPSSKVKVNQFLGVPFAQPPIGNGRFAPPEAPAAWTTPLKTTKYPPSCMQQFDDPPAAQTFQMKLFDTPAPPNGEGEDCLYLNVWAPSTGGSNKTVMFWIYGGGFLFGCNSLPFYDGASFAAHQDVIIVSPNYRTNAFGYPRSPQLPLAESNPGHLDQRLALDWVQRNIHAFGGSPEKVTVFGESAGAVSVDDLITTMPASPPFRAAILESGQTSFGPAQKMNNSEITAWTGLMAALNCTGSDSEILTCARSANATTIKAIAEKGALTFAPMDDNVTHLEDPLAARAAGNIARVPTLAGNNANDGKTFAYPYGNINISTYAENTLGVSIPASVAAKIESLYKLGSSPTLQTRNDLLAAFVTDYTFQCPAALFTNSTIEQARNPAWLYLFSATFANTQHPVYGDLGAWHSSEIPLVYGTYPTTNATMAEKALSVVMQTAWANFAKHPLAGPGWKPWPAVEVFESNGAKSMKVSAVDIRCAYYDKAYARHWGSRR